MQDIFCSVGKSVKICIPELVLLCKFSPNQSRHTISCKRSRALTSGWSLLLLVKLGSNQSLWASSTLNVPWQSMRETPSQWLFFTGIFMYALGKIHLTLVLIHFSRLKRLFWTSFPQKNGSQIFWLRDLTLAKSLGRIGLISNLVKSSGCCVLNNPISISKTLKRLTELRRIRISAQKNRNIWSPFETLKELKF